MIGDSSGWVLVGSVTATRFDHTGQVPGVRVLYRIVARRRNEFSSPSVTAIVYPNNGAAKGQTLRRAA